MSKVIFLGAGFSKAFGLPVMREFFDRADASERLSAEEKELLERLRKQARGAASMVRGGNDDLEHILSFAIMSGAFGDGEETEYLRLQRIVAAVYGDVEIKGSPDSSELAFHQLLELERGGSAQQPVTIITTNYDVLVELICSRAGCPPQVPFEHREPETKGRRLYSSRSQVTLCKLHGSVNWELDEDGIPVLHSGIEFKRMINSGDWDSMIPVEAPVTRSRPLERPYIVPPSLVKERPAPFMRGVLQATRAALAQARSIAFIGFSFPQSDNYLTYLIGPALVDNVRLRQIDVVGPHAKEIVERLRGPASPYGDHMKTLLQPHARPWEEVMQSGPMVTVAG